MFSVSVSILSNSNQLHIATYLENEWGSLKLVHFETVRLNRGPQNKHLQDSMLSLSIFFSWYHLKVRMPYYNNSSKKFCLYMKHCHCMYNTLRVTETGHSRIESVSCHWKQLSFSTLSNPCKIFIIMILVVQWRLSQKLSDCYSWKVTSLFVNKTSAWNLGTRV